jgi:hypothetical protein
VPGPAPVRALATTAPAEHSPHTALRQLADAIDPRDFISTLTAALDPAPCLRIANRHGPLAEDIYADARSYWWSWGEPISAVDDVVAAARKVAAVLKVLT